MSARKLGLLFWLMGVGIARAQEPAEEAPASAPQSEAAPPPAEEPVAAPEPQEPVTNPDPAPLMTPEALQPSEADAMLLGDADLTMTADELAALGLDAAAPSVDPDVKLGGFADFGFGTFIGPYDSYWRSSGSVPAHTTFFVGNLNLYLYKQLTESLRTAIEIRFTYLPNGSGAFGFQPPESTAAFDYTDYGRVTRWGAIIPQRAYVEWTAHEWLTIRGGQFLTPYGIWNVDHGSPVFIPVRRPWSIGVGWIPERQTGIELYGRSDVSNASTLGYHLTLSNGTGPISEYSDLDENKAIGGRVYWEVRNLGFGWLRLGASGYWGRDTDALYTAFISGANTFGATETVNSQYDSLTLAGDLTWKWEGLHVQSEVIVNQRAYTEEGRKVRRTLANVAVIPSDILSFGVYAIVGYRLPWLGIMPFLQGERVIGDLEYLELKLWSFQVGLNVRPIDVLVLKVIWEHVKIEDSGVGANNSLMTQVAWAF